MARIFLAILVFSFSACAAKPSGAHALRRFPHGSAVAKGLDLSPEDEDQICRLIRGASTGRITYVGADLKPNTIMILCELSGTLYSDTVHLQKVDSTWRITGKGLVMR